jgi:hypothetical protein
LENYVIDVPEESDGETNPATLDDLANIPEASPAIAVSRWSKRWARDTDKDYSLERATKLKALHNECDRNQPSMF